MSMFNRNIKLQFNKMKYMNLVAKGNVSNGHHEILGNVVKSRYMAFSIGLFSAQCIYNYDVFKYKTTRGLARWKNRIKGTLGYTKSH